ncbi:hypothetical protein [Saccharopolyspora spinosa]|uniref:C2H2-type domain-containing protein n=1 Tax=Saccharopolyspora spinosa TaxID=60894 RepID=A0A2N3Y8N4_SACSN|nr:hypothetical protein [Saccharopolyspora spinosa]PKW19270.1 hypothetical protein A8926_7434 [Saccharopolyspora spinosa]
MPRRTFTPEHITEWRCSAERCLYTDPDAKVVGQHERDAHGPTWLAADENPDQEATDQETAQAVTAQ